ncbi:hypothetical protein ACGVWS_15750, partial [Enterobacteriaceae bacterium LUAb1]
KLYNPILNPVAFLYEKIAHFIQAYNAETGSTLDVTPDTKVCIVKKNTHIQAFSPRFTHYSPPEIWSVMELASGLHLRGTLSLFSRRSDNNLIYKHPDKKFSASLEWGNAVRKLIHSLQEKVEPLEQEMLRELNLYRNNFANREGMVALYRDMIVLRCLEYLDSPDSIPLYAQAVEKFLQGDIQANVVLFHGVALNGVFMVPAGQYEGVIFSIDESIFYHAGKGKPRRCIGSMRMFNQRFRPGNAPITACNKAYSQYPDTPRFRRWFFSKLPLKHAQHYAGTTDTVFHPTFRMEPVTFRQSMGAAHLANQLFDGLMERIASDIDVLLWTHKEQTDLTLLELLKTLFRFGSLALLIAVPFTGTLLGGVILLAGNAALSAAEMATSWNQAKIVDTEEQISAYLSDTIIAGMLGSLGVLSSGAQLSVKGVQHLLASYRYIRQASGVSTASVISRLKLYRKQLEPVANSQFRKGAALLSENKPHSGIAWSGKIATSLLRRRLVSDWSRRSNGDIMINGRMFKSLSYDQTQQQLMKQKAMRYQPVNNPTHQQKKALEGYQAGQKEADNSLYDNLNSLSLDKQMETYLDDGSTDLVRGVLREKINRGIKDATDYAVAAKAVTWGNAAKKAQEVKLIPQDITLQGRPGECLPAAILMGRALETGWDAHLADRMWQMSFAQKINDDPLYQSLTMLHGEGRSSVFNTTSFYAPGAAIKKPEETLFPAATGSVRVDLKEHTVLISKFFDENKVSRYVFYDPNYGLAYFNKFSDMSDFFVSALKKYRDIDAGVNFRYLDYARVADSGFDAKILDNMIKNSSMS